MSNNGFIHRGWFRVFEGERVIHKIKFKCKKELKYLLQDYIGLSLSIIYDEKEELKLLTK